MSQTKDFMVSYRVRNERRGKKESAKTWINHSAGFCRKISHSCLGVEVD